MNSIARFFDELKHPEKKCKRVGHDVYKHSRHGFAKSWKWEELTKQKEPSYYVAIEFLAHRFVCNRCGREVAPKKYIRKYGLSGLTLSSESMWLLKQEGIVFVGEIKVSKEGEVNAS